MRRLLSGIVPLALSCAGIVANAHAAERITLRSGFVISCDHREALEGERVRLFLGRDSASYMDVAANSIASAEPELLMKPAGSSLQPQLTTHAAAAPRIDELIQTAGARRSLNVDLLRSVVNAESGGHANAVSHAGAQGLMQLMPATARSLGVNDSLAPEENLRGGTDYLDQLLRRYHDDLTLALAAYNAGPGAVDRYHGVPPYRETRLYVARIIREFNRRTLAAARVPALQAGGAPGSATGR